MSHDQTESRNGAGQDEGTHVLGAARPTRVDTVHHSVEVADTRITMNIVRQYAWRKGVWNPRCRRATGSTHGLNDIHAAVVRRKRHACCTAFDSAAVASTFRSAANVFCGVLYSAKRCAIILSWAKKSDFIVQAGYALRCRSEQHRVVRIATHEPTTDCALRREYLPRHVPCD
eukprot:SAG31_NODE_13995_length_833_cov_0.667575_1_plen_173_part_00